ncbi:L,D-transpeptidase family protein [uncultured Ruegeria sp.]|uniref:L,D-transpeptidase family protein n=1 Tax=uncultured Ruegeria sp. TaxID=259304 RepID=UPI002605015C|nr:L,D-transpeptidase family protein [uncultured Ruegeria sp.]
MNKTNAKNLQLTLTCTVSFCCLFVGVLLAKPIEFDNRFQTVLDRYDIDYQIPHEGKAILVNIPSYEMIALERGRPVLRSRIILGTPWHPTPLLETYTPIVRFRPSWRPPPSMVASGEYLDRIWPPSESNPLGLAAVHLRDGRSGYLHDTNCPELFQRPDRAPSHGCIRVQDWGDLVAFVLDTPLEQVHRLANGRQTMDIETPSIPFSVRYLRNFMDITGQLVSSRDIYRRDPFSNAWEQPVKVTCDAAE